MKFNNANRETKVTRKKILIATDAWYPQTNGEVTTLAELAKQLEKLGHDILMVTPQNFLRIPCPTYSEISLALNAWFKFKKIVKKFNPDYIYIATEGPIGHAARKYCKNNDVPFVSNYGTKLPEYISMRFGIPETWIYAYLKNFHKAATHTLVGTQSLKQELSNKGFTNLKLWTRGVDTDLFNPNVPKISTHYKSPMWLYVGRIAKEKNIEAFLNLDIEGSKVIVGDGPQLKQLKKSYPDAIFVGKLKGEELAQYYASATALVFPSKTDTFGLVTLESLASGTPVVGYPVTGPKDIIENQEVGVLDNDLKKATNKVMDIDRNKCREYALDYTWDKSAKSFYKMLV